LLELGIVDMASLGTGLREFAANAAGSVDTAVNETLIRLAVTGLSRAGKTVFITSLIRNLLALGQGRDTLPQLQACLETDGRTRLKHVRVLPAGAATIPYPFL
jgi:predicted YcjX-like family ATPase